MIYTVTLNPAIDYIVRLDHVETGAVNRMASEDKFAGGKGEILFKEYPDIKKGYYLSMRLGLIYHQCKFKDIALTTQVSVPPSCQVVSVLYRKAMS